MVIGKKLKLTRDDALKYLLLETNLFGSLIASVISSFIAFLFTFFILYSGKFIQFEVRQFFFLFLLFMVVGIVLYFIKREEFHLYERTLSDVFIHGLFSYPFYIVVFSVLFIIFLIPQWISASKGNEQNITAMIITIFLVSAGFSYLFNGIWKFFAFYLFQLFADKNWLILAERDHFVSGLGLRYEEARRYGTSLSLIRFSFEKKPSLKRFFKDLFKKMQVAVRDIDTISHFDSWEDWIILAPITELACEGLINRMIKVIKEEMLAKGIKEGIKVSIGISSLDKNTESEFDLLKAKKTIEKVIEV